MGRRKVLEKRLQRLLSRLENLRGKLKATQDVEEARSLAAQIETLNEDMQEVQEELDSLGDPKEPEGGDPQDTPEDTPQPGTPDPDNPDPQPDSRGMQPQVFPGVSIDYLATFGQRQGGGVQQRGTSILDSMEYREAFAAYVRSGDSLRLDALAEKRADETLMTPDVGKIIPNTIMNEFIRELKVYGNLYSRVRKLNVKGGVEFPIQELVPTVSWIAESAVSNTQKAPEIKTSVIFGYSQSN